MDQIPCPDGYLLAAKSPLADAHHALNTYLVAWDEQGWKAATKQLNSLRDKHLKFRIWMAMLERLEWHHATNPGNPYFQHLHDLTYAIEEWKLALTADELITAIRRTTELSEYLMPYSPMPHLMAFVEEHGLTPELSAAVREFDARVRHLPYKINQTRCQLLNSRLDMLAWWDEWNDVDLKRCWSEQIRADYRAMQGAERENWRRLLHSIQGDEAGKPVRSWLTKAEAVIQAIGPPEFRARLLRWFEPLRSGRTVKLSREGSFLLRSLIWLVPPLESPELMAILREIPQVIFKPKKNCDKVVRAASEATGVEYVPKPSAPPPSLDAITARAIAAACAVMPQFAQRVRIDGGIAHIRGDLDRYRMHLSTGAVFRESDGHRVLVALENWVPAPLAGFDFGGIAELLGQIVFLTQDRKHAEAITVTPEVAES